MRDEEKTKKRLVNELAEMRQRIVELEALEAERKRARQALEVSETRYRRLFETAKDGILILDADTGQITDVNPFLMEMLGYSQEEFVGKKLWEIGPFKDVALSKAAFEALQSKGYIRYEDLPLEAGDGRRIDVEFVSNVYPVDHKRVIQCNIRDITERKRAEETLRENEERLKFVLEGSQQGFWDWNIETGEVKRNARWAEMLGYTLPEIELTVKQWTDLIHPDDRAAAWQSIQDHLEGRTPLHEIEYRMLTRYGQYKWILDRARIVKRAPQGRPLRMSGTHTDITERKRADEVLRQYAVELEVRNEELDAFAHTVAHDLQNPLGIVIGYAEILEEGCATLPAEELQEYLHTIAQNGRRLGKIVDELLLLSVLRQAEVEMEPLDMASVVAEAQQRVVDMIEMRQAKIILPNSWSAVLGHGPWVAEVWTNYLSNAIKYGGQPPRVELGTTVQPDGMVRFWVRDNGPGLTPEEQARLFTPFTRLDQVRAKGYGLGLSIVRRIVRKLGGQVGVESKVGQGSVFTFTLPGVAGIETV